MDKFRKKLIKYNADSIIYESDQYHYFNSHKTFICDESVGWRPRVDVYEVKDELFIVADLSYIEPERVEVEVDDDHLVIKGTRDQIGCDKKRHYHKMEIDFGPFERVVNLPFKIDLSTVKQCYRHGFYIITAKKL
ncbi:MAG: Hsp20/alpha crystallin family protein [Candidatus Delongbacteria bacterium]|jgi:HSP20 family protein|nr:Hsp20/alpha crystallin family protein [Candidatus Delongbacteria bacterium]MDD4204624.1 Hsp20/alpha crystallin family protein [Candidatus Delongbacteria bacterium]MDY0017193.1 Hsp20/alpha crystallin family protein [Candidatus Delongbacteria bacterium]